MDIRRAAMWVLISALAGCATPARAQRTETPPAPTLQFDAASVRSTDPNVPGPSEGVNLYPGGRMVLHDVTLKELVEIACNVDYWQIAGGDPWVSKVTYEIEAVPPAAVGPTINLSHTWTSVKDKRLQAMLQSLLASRFKLRLQPATKPGTVYLLRRSSKQLRLQPLAPDGPPAGNGDDGIGTVGYASGKWMLYAEMPQLAWFASSFILHAPVTDQTGLHGAFQFRQSSSDINPQYTGPGNSASFMEFLSEAGLKLTRAQGPVET